MFFLYVLPKSMMIRQNGDRSPKHLCYKNLISFPHTGFPTRFACSVGWWLGGFRAETPEVHCVSRALIIK